MTDTELEQPEPEPKKTPRSSKPFDGFLDAALIAEYARRKRVSEK